jgi:hypothetical protein
MLHYLTSVVGRVGCKISVRGKNDMSQSHISNISLPKYPNRINTHLLHPLRTWLQLITSNYVASIPENLAQIQKVTTPIQLTKLVNKLQTRIWYLPLEEQAIARKQLTGELISFMHHASKPALRIAAASWLRLFVQAAYTSQPEEIFVTLVTALTLNNSQYNGKNTDEQHAYLRMIFDCFWPFRYPYATYNWEKFPNNSVFYPLAPLLSYADACTQDILISIFTELPSLDDSEIVDYVLPFALKWSTDPNPERRQRITTILALMHNDAAQEALNQLQADSHLLVSCKAKRAAEKVRPA